MNRYSIVSAQRPREEFRQWWKSLPHADKLFIPICALNCLGKFFKVLPYKCVKGARGGVKSIPKNYLRNYREKTFL